MIEPEFSHDVFISYTAHAAYRPGGEKHGAIDLWPRTFKRTLDELMGPTAGQGANNDIGQSRSIYLYEERQLGESWRPNVRSACRARVLLPIASETYFESVTCFYEWYAFVTGSTDFGHYAAIKPHRLDKLVPVWRLEGEGAALRDNLQPAMLHRALAAVAATLTNRDGFAPQAARDLVTEWVDMLFGRNAVDLSPFSDAGVKQFTHGDLHALMDDISATVTRLLTTGAQLAPQQQRKLIAQCLLALGLDRFGVGGWGFSLGPEFERDDDGRLLKYGRNELNLLVVRALRWALDCGEYVREAMDALLWRPEVTDIPSIAGSKVKDRKQRAVALSALLHARDVVAIRVELTKRLGDLAAEIDHKPFHQRWVVEQNPLAANYADVVFFNFAATAFEALGDPLLKNDLNEKEIKRNYEEAKHWLRTWLDDRDVFGDIAEIFAMLSPRNPAGGKVASIGGGDLVAARVKYDTDVLLLHIRVLSSIRDSAVIIGARQETIAAMNSIDADLELILACLKQEDRAEADLRAFLRLFPLYCLTIKDLADHYRDSIAIAKHAKRCERHWADLIDCIGASQISRLMNAAGWAATLLLAERSGFEIGQFRGTLTRLWSLAAEARGRRRRVAIEAVRMTPAAARTAFDDFVHEEIARIQSELGSEWIGLADEADILRPLFSFGGNGKGERPGAPSRLGEAVGVLLVNSETDVVIGATAGFNAIYIEPFSARLGIGLNSLDRLVYELGQTDTEFVDALSQSMVIKCWPLEALSARQLEPTNFAERTQTVRQRIKIQQLANRDDPGLSCRDLLQLRTGSDAATRFVLRTCNIVQSDDLAGMAATGFASRHSDAKRIVLWTFIDVSNWMEASSPGFEAMLALSDSLRTAGSARAAH